MRTSEVPEYEEIEYIDDEILFFIPFGTAIMVGGILSHFNINITTLNAILVWVLITACVEYVAYKVCKKEAYRIKIQTAGER